MKLVTMVVASHRHALPMIANSLASQVAPSPQACRRAANHGPSRSNTTTSANTAANDIWKLAPSSVSGWNIRISAAAHATSCSEIGERSRMMASEHHAPHDQRALGRRRPAGETGIEHGREDRERGRPFLDRIAQRHPRHERQRKAQSEEEQAGGDRDMQAGDRQQVRQAGIAHGVEVGGAQRGLVAHRQRDGDGAGRFRQLAADALRDRGARRMDPVGDG